MMPPVPDFLSRAMERVMESYRTEPLLTPDVGLLRGELAAAVEGVRMALDGQVPAQSGGMPLDRLRLLRMLRTAVLEDWSDEDGPLLRTMLAFEATERALRERDGNATPTDELSPFSRKVLREVSHLLRSPLGSIVILTETLKGEKAGPLTQGQQRQLAIIYRAALSAAATAGDLLSLTSREERFESPRRFSVAATLDAVADVVRPVTEARSSQLVVRQGVEGRRLGPASAVGEALLGLALRAALMTREGTVEIEASAGEGDILAFSVTSSAAGASDDEVDPLQIFRADPGSDTFTISADGVAFSAAREIIKSMGSELHGDASPEGRLTLLFRIALPVAD